MIFAGQAQRLQVQIGDRITAVAETAQGTRNSVELQIVAVAKDIGFLSNFGIFVHEDAVRTLYDLDDDVTGAIFVYLDDHETSGQVLEHLRGVFEAKGYELLPHEPAPFFTKFGPIAGQDWTGQRLDISIWRDEVVFLTWVLTAVDTVSFALVSVLVVLIAIGIMNSMWVAVRERTTEIGTLRAIGMSRGRVLLMFLLVSIAPRRLLDDHRRDRREPHRDIPGRGEPAIPVDAIRAILMSDHLHLVVGPERRPGRHRRLHPPRRARGAASGAPRFEASARDRDTSHRIVRHERKTT
ncbi:MAG: hypothetical protein HC923_05175 [Myxococcales bacterium]|nr:hypothetical protein [Myxococcales bacterium]